MVGITIGYPLCSGLEAGGRPLYLSGLPHLLSPLICHQRDPQEFLSSFLPGTRLNIWQKELPIGIITTSVYCDLIASE